MQTMTENKRTHTAGNLQLEYNMTVKGRLHGRHRYNEYCTLIGNPNNVLVAYLNFNCR